MEGEMNEKVQVSARIPVLGPNSVLFSSVPGCGREIYGRKKRRQYV